jgi:hypothetical protein
MGKKFNAILNSPKLDSLLVNPVPYEFRNYKGNALNEYLASFSMDDLQKSVLIGCLLGDASLSNNKGRNFFCKFEQKAANLGYIDLLYSIFAPVVGTPPAPRYVNDKLHSYWFRTYRLSSLKFYADTFYPIDPQTQKRRRRVPRNIHRFLNPIVLAFWFMDDGSMNPNGSGCILHTECFPRNEVVLLQKALGHVFHLETSVHKDDRTKKTGKIYYRLYISQKSTREFMRLISPLVHPCMHYKLRKFEDDISKDI